MPKRKTKAKQQAAPRHRKRPDALAKLIGQRVKGLREEQDFSFDAFVEETGLGRGYISELERGLVVPTVTSLAKVAAALELTIADLVLGETPREQLLSLTRDLEPSLVQELLATARRMAATARASRRD